VLTAMVSCERPPAAQPRRRARAHGARPQGSTASPEGRVALATAPPRGGPQATIEEAALAASSLVALTGVAYQEACADPARDGRTSD